MIRYLLSLILALLVATSTVVSSAYAIQTKVDCCCTVADDKSNANYIIKSLNTNVEVIANDSSCCCAPIPNHKLPQTVLKIESNPVHTALQATSLVKLFDPRLQKISVSIDTRRPLHLASNELYLKKRALLI